MQPSSYIGQCKAWLKIVIGPISSRRLLEKKVTQLWRCLTNMYFDDDDIEDL